MGSPADEKNMEPVEKEKDQFLNYSLLDMVDLTNPCDSYCLGKGRIAF